MEIIKDQFFEGERPLYCKRDGLRLENVKIGPGESSLKEGAGIEAVRCEFNGKYPFWECDGFTVRDSIFREGARAALWYSRNLDMQNTRIEAPKMFREMDGIVLRHVQLSNAQETLWSCRNVDIEDVSADHGDYIFMHSSDIKVRDLRLNGNYSFQWCRNVEIHDSVLNTKDAFWETDNVTVYDSEINGEYLGWHSKNLRLVNCHITGEQVLCYAHDLVIENCTFGEDCDRMFEYSTLRADIKGKVTNIKNPTSGLIIADEIGSVTIDENIKQPADCVIKLRKDC